MKVSAFLVVNQRGNVRVTKSRGRLESNEIRLRIDLDIPRGFFERPEPVVSISVPGVASIEPDVAVAITAETVATALGVDVREVHDGLVEIVRRHHEESEDQP